MKEEALKLADELEKPVSVPNQHDMIYIDGHRMYGAQMIRRLVEELENERRKAKAFRQSNQVADTQIKALVEELDKQVKPIGVYDGKNVHIYTPQVKQGEPVAWMSPDGKVSQTEGRLFYIPLYTTSQTKPLSDEEIGDCVDDCFGLMALQHKYTYSIDQVQEYGLKLCKAIEERHGIK